MAAGQPHLSIQMSDWNTNGVPSRQQSSPDLAGRGGSILTFHNICYHVKMKTGFLCCQKPADKEVLRDVKYVFKHRFKLCVWFISARTAKSTPVPELLSVIYRICSGFSPARGGTSSWPPLAQGHASQFWLLHNLARLPLCPGV